MRRLAILGVASVTTLALATPALAGAATAAHDGSSTRSSHAASAKVEKVEKKKPSIRLKRSKKGVQPGIGKQKITARVNGGGKVKFTLKGTGIKLKKNVKVKNGKAVYKVPPLGTGKYKVQGTYNGKKAKTKFKVYDSALTVNATTFTVSASNAYNTSVPLTGNVKFKAKPAKVGGYVDLYKDGNTKGGAESPDFLGFGTIVEGGGFTYQYFAKDVAATYGVGTWNFQAFYTDDAGFDDYISSNFIVVTVVA
jgi:hypothetical protein